jgi:hypothetical protein
VSRWASTRSRVTIPRLPNFSMKAPTGCPAR